MCKGVATNIMLVISLSLTWYQCHHLSIVTEFKTPYPLTSSTHLPVSVSSSSSDSIVTPTQTTIQGTYVLLLVLTCLKIFCTNSCVKE